MWFEIFKFWALKFGQTLRARSTLQGKALEDQRSWGPQRAWNYLVFELEFSGFYIL